MKNGMARVVPWALTFDQYASIFCPHESVVRVSNWSGDRISLLIGTHIATNYSRNKLEERQESLKMGYFLINAILGGQGSPRIVLSGLIVASIAGGAGAGLDWSINTFTVKEHAWGVKSHEVDNCWNDVLCKSLVAALSLIVVLSI